MINLSSNAFCKKRMEYSILAKLQIFYNSLLKKNKRYQMKSKTRKAKNAAIYATS